jgi:hypothetical protein
MKNKLTADGLGLIVPMNVEALCVHEGAGDIFKPAPYNFNDLPNGNQTDVPNLSDKIMAGDGLVSMGVGVHLHWALPDGLTRGTSPQDAAGKVAFPDTPDRWLITRVYSDISDLKTPVNRVKSWVIESNYVSEKQPDQQRLSIAVPFKTSDNKGPQYRFMGRVQEYETWIAQQLLKRSNPQAAAAEADNFVEGLSAVGYGSPEFSASYQNCKSIFGFYDTDTDLAKLGNNIQLSYHMVGWYHELINDPLSQLPLQFDPSSFEAILNKVASGPDKDALNKAYTIRQQDGPYVLASGISAEDKIKLIGILTGAGFSFLDYVLKQCKWSLPSRTIETNPQVTHTIMTGMISNITWDKNVSSFKAVNEKVNIAIGNTSSQALAALIAEVSKLPQPENIELLLDALQLGKLKGVTNADELNRLEDLTIALHTSGYSSTEGGRLWEVTKIDDDGTNTGLRALADTMGDDLNKLNGLQIAYDNSVNDIASMRTQIFMDWYRFMLVLHRGNLDPNHGMDPGDMAELILGEIEALKKKIGDTSTGPIEELAKTIRAKLPADFKLADVSTSRYWQPAEPVILFQGKDITPPERYGGDGRFMADDTLACRLSSQLITSATIPAGLVGNAAQLFFDAQNTPNLSQAIPLDYSAQIHALFTESCLMNQSVVAVLCLASGATSDFKTISQNILDNRLKYVAPPVLQQLSVSAVDRIKGIIAEADFNFFLTLYVLSNGEYILQKPIANITANELKRLNYIFVSSAEGWGSQIGYAGLAPSLVYFVEWNFNPWLPFSLSWKITYYPFANVKPDKDGNDISVPFTYDPNFIINNFSLGDVSYEYNGPLNIPSYQSYSNFIFMSPHAEENFQVQIKKFIDAQPGPLDKDLKEILESLKNFPPVLSQSFNGLNDAMIMRNQVLQLQVKDPVPNNFYNFTNIQVRGAVDAMTQSAPSPGNYYNPVRAGLMAISSVTIVDVFGRNIQINTPEKIIVASSLKTPGLAANYVYLPPALVQSSRLMFRWLAASNNEKDTNSHPSTSPICGWILANHLDSSLWFYDHEGAPLGSLILSEDVQRVVWQGVPGSDSFDTSILQFFETGPGANANEQLKKLALALYNDGKGDYLDAFMRANDTTYSLIQPQNYKQMGSNAVLLGSPIAVAQASLSLDLKGTPAYSLGWDDMKKEVNDGAPKNDEGFSKIKFPVRLGNMKQVDDGLLGYFKNGDYSHYYTVHTKKPTDKVTEPTETTITLAVEESSRETIVAILLDPRGGVHATTGLLPVKKIDIPPSQFADSLENLEIAFLTTPVMYNANKPAFPVPAEGGGEWTWLENKLAEWSEPQKIEPVDDRANLNDQPQEIKEGWLLLRNFKK